MTEIVHNSVKTGEFIIFSIESSRDLGRDFVDCIYCIERYI